MIVYSLKNSPSLFEFPNLFLLSKMPVVVLVSGIDSTIIILLVQVVAIHIWVILTLSLLSQLQVMFLFAMTEVLKQPNVARSSLSL